MADATQSALAAPDWAQEGAPPASSAVPDWAQDEPTTAAAVPQSALVVPDWAQEPTPTTTTAPVPATPPTAQPSAPQATAQRMAEAVKGAGASPSQLPEVVIQPRARTWMDVHTGQDDAGAPAKAAPSPATAQKVPTWADVARAVPTEIGAKIESVGAGYQEHGGASEYADARKKFWQSVILPRAVRESRDLGIALTDHPDVEDEAKRLGMRPDVFARDWPKYANMSDDDLAKFQAEQRARIETGQAQELQGEKRRQTVAQVRQGYEPQLAPFSAKGIAFNVATTVPELLAGTAAGMVGGAPAAAGALLADAAPQSYAAARNAGADDNTATNYAVLSGIAQSVPEIPVFKVIGDTGTGRAILETAVGRTLARTTAGKIAGTAVTQGVTQAAIQALQTGIDAGVIAQHTDLSTALQRIGQAGIVGAISGAPLGAMHAGLHPVRGAVKGAARASDVLGALAGAGADRLREAALRRELGLARTSDAGTPSGEIQLAGEPLGFIPGPQASSKTPQTLSERLSSDQTLRQGLEAMKAETGWYQKGGYQIRDPETDEVTGRTKWIPNADWWRDRPRGMTEEEVHNAVDKALAGEDLTDEQQRFVQFMADVHDERTARAATAGELAAAAPEVGHEAAPLPDLSVLTERAGAVDREATTGVLDSWLDDKPETLARVQSDLERIIGRGVEDQRNGPEQPAQARGVPSEEGGQGAQARFVADLERARSETDTAPSEAEKTAGNYAKGELSFAPGIRFTMENPRGSTRSGTDAQGKPWRSTLANDYGYLNRTRASDGEQVDAFLTGKPDTGKVFVVNQVDPKTGKFDEPKAVLGASSAQEAQQTYRANYPSGWKGEGSIAEMSTGRFRDWLENGDTTKPAPLGGERRANPAQRARVAEMSPEELRASLLTHELTGIPNRRAYRESEKLPVQVSVDANSLKWVNDVGGHAAGDEVLRTIAQALHDETPHAYHFGGDEFAVQAESPEEAERVVGRAKERLSKARITLEDRNGRKIELNGIGIAHGTGRTLQEADRALEGEKERQQAAGVRARRGEPPPEATGRVAPERLPARENRAAAEVAPAGAAAEAVRFSRRAVRPFTIHPEDDEPTVLAKVLANAEGAFRHPISHEKTLEGVVRDLAPDFDVEKHGTSFRPRYEIWHTRVEGGKRVRIGRSAHVTVNPDHTVILDISGFDPGQSGSSIYQAIGDFAHNSGLKFIGDPGGLSPYAQIRRTVQMLSSALRWGTTRHLGGHELLEHPEVRGLRPLGWREGDDAHNIRALVRTVIANYDHLVPEIRDLRYNWDTKRFEDANGRPVSDLDFRRIGESARGRTLDVDRRAGGLRYKTPAGGQILKTVTLLKSGLPRLHGGGLAELSRVLSEHSDRGRSDLTPLGVGEPFYNRSASGRGLAPEHVEHIVREAVRHGNFEGGRGFPHVEVHDDTTTLPAHIQDVIARDEAEHTTGAVYDPGTDTIHLVAANNGSEQEVRENLWHEAVGHHGLRLIMDPQRYAEVMDGIARDMPARVQAAARRNGLDLGDLRQRRVAAEEVIAYAAGRILTGQPMERSMLPHWQRALNAIRAFFARIRGKPFYDENEIASLVAESAKAVKLGNYRTRLNVMDEARRAARAATWYSPLERAVESSKQGKASPEQWLATLGRQPGVKPEEREWSGVDDWLKEQKGPVTREQVLDYLRANRLEIQETLHGGMGEQGAATPAEAERDRIVDDLRARGYEPVIEGGVLQSIGVPVEGAPTGMEPTFLHDPEDVEDLPPDVRDQVKRLSDLTGEIATQRFVRSEEVNEQHPEPTRYGEYTLPGGENYRELLIQLPQRPGESMFRSGHWEEPNVLAHVRFSDRTDADGKKTLFIEEVQSDWHQRGREVGYRGPADDRAHAELERSVKEAQERYAAAVDASVGAREALGRGELSGEQVVEAARQRERAYEALRQAESARDAARERAVPSAPFKTSWPSLVMRRMMRFAAEHGYERIAWTTGDTQTGRYPREEGTPEKEAQERGMRGFYDEILPRETGKLVKRWGGKVSREPLRIGPTPSNLVGADKYASLGLDVVDRGMGAATENDKVVRAVVGALPVDVVHVLAAHGLDPEALVRHPQVLLDDLPADRSLSVADGLRGALSETATRLRTGFHSAYESGLDGELLPALRASDLDTHVAAGIAFPESLRRGGSVADGNLAMREGGAALGTETGRGAMRPVDEARAAELADFQRWHQTISRAPARIMPERWAYEITPEMRQAALGEGMPLFARREAARQGGIAGGRPAVRSEPLELGEPPEEGTGAYERLRRAVDYVAHDNPVMRGVRSLVAPVGLSHESMETARLATKAFGQLAADTHQVREHLEQFARTMEKLPIEDQLEMIDAIENGRPQPHPELQGVADAMRKTLDHWRDEVQRLGNGYLENFIENYFPHYWADEAKAKRLMASVMGRRPLRGPASFLKRRTIATIKEGMDAGLRPLTTNPLVMTLMKTREMQRFVTGINLMRMLKAHGLAEFLRAGRPMPEGWASINDASARVRQWSEVEQGFIERGQYIMPADAARLINNHLGGSWLKNGPFGPIAQALRLGANALNAVQLGFSAFHLGFTTLDAVISKNALAFERLLHGEPVKAAAAFGEALTGPGAAALNVRRGYQLMEAYSNPAKATPQLQKIVKALIASGGRVHMDRYFAASEGGSPFRGAHVLGLGRGSLIGEVREGAREGGAAGAAQALTQWSRDYPVKLWRTTQEIARTYPLLAVPFEMVGRFTRASSAWIMEKVVPLQKLGVFSDLAQDYLRRNPTAGPDELARAMQSAWRSVDNRLGEMVYDNLFWNRTFKDAMHLGIRAVGWNVGTVREIGGAAVDALGALDKLARTGKLTADDLGHKIPYVLAMTLTSAMAGAATQYLLTGQPPQELKDYFFPRTGGFDQYGNPERLSLPSYIKDVYAFSLRPGKTIVNKLNPIWSTLADIYENEDYFGRPISDPEASMIEQAWQRAGFAVHEAMPFSLQGAKQIAGSEGAGLGARAKRALPFVGVTPAPGYITSTEEEQRFERAQAEEGYVHSLRSELNAAQATGNQQAVSALQAKFDAANARSLELQYESHQDYIKKLAAELARAKETGNKEAASYLGIKYDDALKEQKSLHKRSFEARARARATTSQNLRRGGKPATAALVDSLPLTLDSDARAALARLVNAAVPAADAADARPSASMGSDPRYETSLSPEQQRGYRVWLARMERQVGHALSSDDYDMPGAYLAGLKPGPNAHFDDEFKKPNHFTFSTDSKYSGHPYVGGAWTRSGARWVFRASPDNLRFHTAQQLIDYFKRVEPDSVLYLPGQRAPAYEPRDAGPARAAG